MKNDEKIGDQKKKFSFISWYLVKSGKITTTNGP